MTLIWHNAAFKNDDPVFASNDRIRLGHGVFDTMLALDGACVHGERHMERLIRHAGILGIAPSYPAQELLDAAHALLRKSNLITGRHVINTIITAGPNQGGLIALSPMDVQCVIRTRPLPVRMDTPLRAIIARNVRRNEGSPLSGIKSCNYGDSVLAAQEAAGNGAHEAIMLNNRGHVACATSSNVFIVKQGRLLTPPLEDGCMDGIVRALMIERLGAIESSLTPDDLLQSDGIYLSSSVRGVAALESLDGKKLPLPSLKIDKDFHVS